MIGKTWKSTNLIFYWQNRKTFACEILLLATAMRAILAYPVIVWCVRCVWARACDIAHHSWASLNNHAPFHLWREKNLVQYQIVSKCYDPIATFWYKDALWGLRQFLAIECPLKTMRNAFYFTLKAIFILKIFTFSSWLFGHVEKTPRVERQG